MRIQNQTTLKAIADLAAREPIALSDRDLRARVVRLAEDATTLDRVAQTIALDQGVSYSQVVDEVMTLATEFRSDVLRDKALIDPETQALHDRILARCVETGRGYTEVADEILGGS